MNDLKEKGWMFIPNISPEQFIFKMLDLGKPIQVSLVGAFDDSGRGSRRDLDLPLHRDGDYSTDFKGKIEYVGLFCLRTDGAAVTIVKGISDSFEGRLLKNQALIIDNNTCQHARTGSVESRILLRIWIGE